MKHTDGNVLHKRVESEVKGNMLPLKDKADPPLSESGINMSSVFWVPIIEHHQDMRGITDNAMVGQGPKSVLREIKWVNGRRPIHSAAVGS